MRLPTLHSRIGKDYAWELSFLHRIRSFDDGLSIFEVECGFDWYRGDHNPKFQLLIVLFNFKLIEFDVYNVHHVDDDEEDEGEVPTV